MALTFTNLPNQTPTPNPNNLTSEAEKYYQLYISKNRTESGTESFVSESSGKTYSTDNYSSDVDVYNKGQLGLMNLLYKYVLKTYIVEADLINSLLNSITNVTIDATANYVSNSNLYTLTIQNEPETTLYTIRFKTPNDYVANAKFSINNVQYTPALSGSSASMPAKTFVQNRVITANVDKSLKIITFTSSASSSVIISSTSPTSAEDKLKLWVNSSNSTLNYWNGSSWKSIVGVWG